MTTMSWLTRSATGAKVIVMGLIPVLKVLKHEHNGGHRNDNRQVRKETR